MTEVIAGLAFCASVLLLIVQYRNHVERRHGEIARLRSEMLMKLSATHQRLTSLQLHMETARLELRRMVDSDDKYNSIEMMPRLIEKIKKAVGKQADLQSSLDRLDTTKANRGVVLMTLQSLEHDCRAMDDLASEAEQQALDALKFICSKQEAADQATRSRA